MNMGKLAESALQRSVIREVKKMNKSSNAGVGVDAGILTENTCVAVQCMSGNEAGLTELCIYRAVNSLTASGAAAESISLTLALPYEDAEARAKAAMKEAARACAQARVNLIAGNTIVTGNEQLTVSVNAYGTKAPTKTPEHGEGDCPKVLLMIGNTGTAGAAMLAANRKNELCKRLPETFIERAENLADCLLDKELAKLCLEYGALMHDCEDGGVFGALWELCEREGVGCEINIKDIPISQVTVEICEFFDINPYTMRGDGACLAIVEDEPEICSRGQVIGRITKDKSRVVVIGEERRFLEPNRVDDYHNIKKED